jgi:pimeloyl-ACP methyl ester carboxylesterase
MIDLLNRDYSLFCHEGAGYRAEYVVLPSGVELLAVVFSPPDPAGSPPIMFVPGLISIIENFRETLVELTRSHTVVYVETREKSTAKIGETHRFFVGDIAADLVYFAEHWFPGNTPYSMVGYSLGATAIAEAVAVSSRKPVSVVLIQPNASFPFNVLARVLARVARYIYRPLVPVVKWYLRTFIIDIKADLEMYLINCRNLDTAEPVRLGTAVRQLRHYRMNGCLEQITVPALVVVASKDRFHSHGEGTEIAERISGACFLDLEDNKRTHSAEMGYEISRFISSPEQTPVREDQPQP